MPIDSYSLCPCGTGKKIKFCCPDLLKELEHIQELLEGDQRMACLQYIDGLAPEIQERASILATKAMVQVQQGDVEAVEKTLAVFIEKHPNNPVALAEKAMLSASQRQIDQAVDELQHSIQMIDGSMPHRTYEAINVLGQVLLSTNHIFAGRAHLSLQAVLAGDQDPRPAKVLNNMNNDPNVPLIMKDDPQLVECPEDAAYKAEFDETMKLGFRGAWLIAANQLRTLAEKYPDAQPIWRNIATFYAYSAKEDQAVEALRKVSELADSEEERIEAEAIAQFLELEDPADIIDELVVTLPITDMDTALPQLLASKQASKMPVDVNQFAKEGYPPPKDVFWLMDREVPASGEGIKFSDAPIILGEMYLFGRETDREARIELAVAECEKDRAVECIKKIMGDVVQDPSDQKLIGKVSKVDHALKVRMRLPDGATREDHQRVQIEQANNSYLEIWPNLPQVRFGEKSPSQVAGDDQYRLALQASILLLELNAQNQVNEFDFNQLRTKLGLPTAELIDPGTVDFSKIPLIRVSRLQLDKMATENLLKLHNWCAWNSARGGLGRITLELLKRDDYDKEQIKRSELFGVLAEIAVDSDKALDYLQQAIATAKEEGGHIGPWLIRELTLRISRNDATEAQELLGVLQAQHIEEPGVAQALYQIMAQLGLIDPQQVAAMQAMQGGMPQQPGGGGPANSGLFVPGGASAPPQPPAAPQPVAPPAEKKEESGLWLPGMD